MRITVEIDESDLKLVQDFTGERKKSPAVQKAIEGFLLERRRHAVIEDIRHGDFDYPMTNDELEAFESAPDRNFSLD